MLFNLEACSIDVYRPVLMGPEAYCFLNLFQIRTLGMLRSRFQSIPGAFNACLIPSENIERKKKGLKATLSRNFEEVLYFIFYNL